MTNILKNCGFNKISGQGAPSLAEFFGPGPLDEGATATKADPLGIGVASLASKNAERLRISVLRAA
jgi:hypothetical protein